MAIIVEGRGIALLILLLSYILFYIFMYLGRKGWEIPIRMLPPMAAIPEAVGRAAEMGKPVFYTTGIGGGLNDPTQGPQILASMSIMGYVARECVKAGVKMDSFIPIADAIPLAEETLRMAYLAEGRPEEFSTEMIHYIAGQSPYLTGVLGYFQRERPASNFLIGGFYYESVVMGEGGNTIGAFQIGGTANTHQMPFLVATCDYVLLAEELYAAGASISKDPDILGCLRGEDIMKFILVVLMIVGFLLGFARVETLIKVLGW
jgi:hypothetical protein